MPCNIAHDGFDHDHALGAAESSEGGVTLGVGFASVGADRHVLQEVSVVHMEDGAVGYGAGEIGRKAAVHAHADLQAAEQTLIIKAHFIVVVKRVALAGDQKIIIAVEPELHCCAEFARCQRRPDR